MYFKIGNDFAVSSEFPKTETKGQPATGDTFSQTMPATSNQQLFEIHNFSSFCYLYYQM